METTDLSELDAPKVAEGQAVTVFIKALGREVTGRMRLISQQADRLGGDVMCQTIVDLDEQPVGLRAGIER